MPNLKPLELLGFCMHNYFASRCESGIHVGVECPLRLRQLLSGSYWVCGIDHLITIIVHFRFVSGRKWSDSNRADDSDSCPYHPVLRGVDDNVLPIPAVPTSQ